MNFRILPRFHQSAGVLLGGITLLVATVLGVGCGGTTKVQGTLPGTVVVSISDPPSCMAPNGSSTSFTSVFITVRSVQAHIDPKADDNSSGWRRACQREATNKSGSCWFRIILPPARQRLRATRARGTVSIAWCSATTPSTNCNSAARTIQD